jgi:hypothetical protein
MENFRRNLQPLEIPRRGTVVPPVSPFHENPEINEKLEKLFALFAYKPSRGCEAPGIFTHLDPKHYWMIDRMWSLVLNGKIDEFCQLLDELQPTPDKLVPPNFEEVNSKLNALLVKLREEEGIWIL